MATINCKSSGLAAKQRLEKIPFLKHFAAYIDIVASSYRVALVLEDDAAFAFSSPDDAAAYMDLILSEADGIDYDILMLGTCSGAAPSSMYDEQIINIWRATESTCSHAYLVTPSGAEKMLKSLPLRALVIDYHMNYLVKHASLVMLRAAPPMIGQAHTGVPKRFEMMTKAYFSDRAKKSIRKINRCFDRWQKL